MTEAEWLAADNQRRMQAFWLLGPRRGRLFGVACCRLLGFWPYPEVGQALDAAETFADTGKTKAALRRGRQAVQVLRNEMAASAEVDVRQESTSMFVVQMVASENATHGILPGRDEAAWFADTATETLRRMYPVYAEIAGPSKLYLPPTFHTPTVEAIAAGCYAARDFARLPVLADALEDAGCDNVELLAHLRGPGPHARGCWALDLVLGKA